MNISDISTAFPEIKLPDIGSYYSEKIAVWQRIYENEPYWKYVRKRSLKKKGRRKMELLNTAKVLCDCFSDLTFSEQVEITLSDDQYQEYIMKQLERCGFWENLPELISKTYAMGGGAVKVYAENKQPEIDYVHGSKFVPTEWTGKKITGGIFISESVRNGHYYTLLERHSGSRIEHRLYRSECRSYIGTQCDLSELYSFNDIADYGSGCPMFAYFRPCVSNNAEYDAPLGMSIYANSIDTLKTIDTVFDSFSREFVLGKKRIIVPVRAVQSAVEPEEGRLVTYFDEDDEAFVALNTEDNEALKITDNTVSLRVQEHVSAINALLNILCFQVGLSAGTLSFDAVQGMKTATEVISQDSKTARTIKSNKNLLAETIETLIHALIAVGVYLRLIPKKEYSVTVGWQDNVIIDDNTLIDNNIKLVQAGLKSKLRAIMEIQKCDEKTAEKELKRIAEEQSVDGSAIDELLMNGGENSDENRADESESGAE